VAHELRTPLHIIQGNLEGVLDGVYAPTEEHIRATLEEARSLARLVDDLQTLARAEAGQLSLVMEPVDVGELLADLKTSFDPQARAGGVELTVEIDAPTTTRNQPSPLIVRGDAGRLDQVLTTLVANALRHTPPDGQVILRARPVPDHVRITVRDTGEGIPAEDLSHIFDRFWRGDRARTHADNVGGGLGLAIVRQLVQAHGGRIAVESAPGEGTTFQIDLPTG
jgi:two-component system sensor histidine kinase BaeS